MQVSDFRYELPEELIAQYPPAERAASRLLCLDGSSGRVSDRRFEQLPDLLEPEDLLVFNNTRVIPARLLGTKATGGRIEVMVERVLDEHRVLAHTRASKSPRVGTRLELEEAVEAQVLNREGDLFEIEFSGDRPVLDVLDRYGRIPLPPYIQRQDDALDRERYQTVYATRPGAVAAPTAGLHFDEPMMARVKDKGIDIAYVTLHVGAGTFQPVRVENLADHVMHGELVDVPESVVAQVTAARRRGGRVIAVGTTSVRSLEAASQGPEGLAPFQGETRLFIYPGYRFRSVDAMVTNFHLPESTLLMLVCAFAGREHVLDAYRHAVAARYRFFSYGDAMYVTKKEP